MLLTFNIYSKKIGQLVQRDQSLSPIRILGGMTHIEFIKEEVQGRHFI